MKGLKRRVIEPAPGIGQLVTPTNSCSVAGAPFFSLADPVPGEVIATPVTGAYGYSLANNYNGVPRPPVIFCRGGTARVVVRRETYDDLAARDLA